MSKLKYIAALSCLLAAACQSPQPSELLSNEQLMEGLEDGVASETRFLMQHWGARQEFTFSGSSGAWPRDRKSFGRLLCTGNVDYFIRLAHAKDPVVAAYGVEGVRILKRERLPELLPMLLERREYFHQLWDDQGSSHTMPELAALALKQIGADTADAEIARYFDLWLCRVYDTSTADDDPKVARAFLTLRNWPDLQKLELSSKAREVLPFIPILSGTRYRKELVDGFEKTDLAALTLTPGSVARRVAFQFLYGGGPRIVYHDVPTTGLEGALAAVAGRSFPILPNSRNLSQLQLERFAAELTYPDFRYRDARGLQCLDRIAPWRKLGPADWDYLKRHANIVVRQCATAIEAHPYMRLAKDPPQDSESLKYWLYANGRRYPRSDPEAVDAFLAKHPERFPQVDTEECYYAFLYRDAQAYDNAWFQPGFTHTSGGLPRHWLAFAKSQRTDLRHCFYRAIWALTSEELNRFMPDDAGYWAEVRKQIELHAAGTELTTKWLAREWLCRFADSINGGRPEAAKLALTYMHELAHDYLSQPHIAPYCYEIARLAAQALCEAANEDYWGEPQAAGKLGTPLWQLLCRILDASPVFDSREQWPPENPEWLTLAEMRKFETEPAAFWRELQRDYAALPK